MPPKRKPVKVDDQATTTVVADPTPIPIQSSTQDDNNQPSKKQKTLTDSNKSDDKADSDDEDDRPGCMYGASCYRKNPDHFKQFKHPSDHPMAVKKQKSKSSISNSQSSNSQSSQSVVASAPVPKMDDSPAKNNTSSASSSDKIKIDSYKGILLCALAKHKITADDKRLLRTYRKQNNINDDEHNALLKKLGWTADEYEDGEKKEDDIEVDEERKVYEDEDGFDIITITKEAAAKNKHFQAVFSKVSSMFYETMSKAQGVKIFQKKKLNS